jgi:hypothetical protein
MALPADDDWAVASDRRRKRNRQSQARGARLSAMPRSRASLNCQALTPPTPNALDRDIHQHARHRNRSPRRCANRRRDQRAEDGICAQLIMRISGAGDRGEHGERCVRSGGTRAADCRRAASGRSRAAPRATRSNAPRRHAPARCRARHRPRSIADARCVDRVRVVGILRQEVIVGVERDRPPARVERATVELIDAAFA